MKKISVLLLVGWGVVLYANANAIPAREFNPENLIAEWQTLAAGGVKVDSLIKGYSESAPVTDLGGGVVSLPVQFEGSNIERANWDIPVKLDMNRAIGVTFDFYCADISCFSSFSIYLRADGRWLHGMFAPETNGEWSRIRVLKTAFKEDSTNSRISSFRQVDCIRISGWRAKDVDTICALANMAIIPVDPDVLVIRGVSSATDKKNESEYMLFASNLEKTLKKLDVDYISVDDRELIADDFKGVAVAALAYSKILPPNVLPLLEDFTRRGGK